MKRLLKNGTIVNVFTGELIKTNVLFETELFWAWTTTVTMKQMK